MAESSTVSSLRIPDVLRARIDAAAGEGKRSDWILEACRMRLDRQEFLKSMAGSEVMDSSPMFDAPPPDMQALRDICAGKIEAKSSAVKHPQVFYDSQGVTIVEGYVSTWTRNTCGKTWWEDGEQYECLMDAGHKNPKHGQGWMVRRVEA